MAQSFSSSFPNFVRIMKKFNISGSYTLVNSLIFHLLLLSLTEIFCSFKVSFVSYYFNNIIYQCITT